MAILPLTIAPDPIYSSISTEVSSVDNEIRQLMTDMKETLYASHGVGIAAPMVGVTKRVIVVDLQEDIALEPFYMANPQIIHFSEDKVAQFEASLTFLGVNTEITRPTAITVEYLDFNGDKKTLEAQGLLATVIQHEIDYLDGKNLMTYVTSSLKKDMMLRKMIKNKKNYQPPHADAHVHDENCSH